MILAHSTHTWLPLTEQWIYRQVKNINGLDQIVLCDKKDDTFGELVKTYYNPYSPFDLRSRIRNKLGLPDAFRNGILNEYNEVTLFSHYGVQGYHDLRLKKKRHITRFYGYDLTRTMAADQRWKKRYEKLFDECDTFIVEGTYMKQILHGLGCMENKIKVSYLGTDTAAIPFFHRQEGEVFNVLIACATAERKGIIYALQALNILIHQYKIPVHIHWIGDRNSNYSAYIQYENLLNDFIAKHALKPFITRYGFVSPEALQEIAGLCQIAIHPSVWAADGDCEGGYPVVLVDLMAGGLPIISTRHCDIPEVVTPSNGYLCEEKNVDQLIDALMESYTSKTYLEKSVLARKSIEEKFDWKLLGKELSSIILNSPNPPNAKQ